MPNIITRGAMSAKALGFTGQTDAPVYVEDVFSTYLYTGTGATQTFNNGIDLSTKGGLVWIKRRDAAFSHSLANTVLGTSYGLNTNSTNGAFSPSQIGSFNTNGFSLPNSPDNTSGANGGTYASWTFRKQPKFFTIVTWTGNGTDNRLILHDLGTTPGMVIVKNYTTGTATDWVTWHKSLGNMTNNIYLNATLAASQDFMFSSTNLTATATTFPVSASGGGNGPNQNGQTYVAYLFADQAGGFGLSGSDSVVACGGYTGGTDGNTFVNLGWEPQFILLKRTSSGSQWCIVDNMRGMPSVGGTGGLARIEANNSNAEISSGYAGARISATGFYPWGNGGGDWNANGAEYIYLAIRRGPMKVPTDATKVFAPFAYNSSLSPGTTITTGFPVDMSLLSIISGSDKWLFDRLRSNSSTAYAVLKTNLTNAQASGTNNGVSFQSNTSVIENWMGAVASSVIWNFRRAPGFFDEVCYTGTGSATTVAHNLGVVPELIIIKTRSGVNDWYVQSSALPSTTDSYIFLNSSTSVQSYSSVWTVPTTTTFGFQLSAAGINSSGATYVAYLFATCPGVSKVGSYTGTGAAQNIDCGFSAGARFVLIKRTDSTGDWYTYDSARGISSGNDPYLFLNSTAAEVTGTNYVDTFASGFTLTASAPAGLNANGGSYIFLAIA